MVERDFYLVLGVSEDVSAAELAKTYRRLCKLHHPDLGGDPERFRYITQAYAVVSHPERRERYDGQLRSQRESKRSRATATSAWSVPL